MRGMQLCNVNYTKMCDDIQGVYVEVIAAKVTRK